MSPLHEPPVPAQNGLFIASSPLLNMGHLYPGRTQLSDFTFTFHFHALEKEMATHSSVLAWRIPGDGGAWWAAIYGVTQSQTRLKQLSSSMVNGT